MEARKLTFAALALALLAALAWLRRPAADLVLAAATWVEGLGWVAPVAFTALLAVAVPLFVPATPFLLAGNTSVARTQIDNVWPEPPVLGHRDRRYASAQSGPRDIRPVADTNYHL